MICHAKKHFFQTIRCVHIKFGRKRTKICGFSRISEENNELHVDILMMSLDQFVTLLSHFVKKLIELILM